MSLSSLTETRGEVRDALQAEPNRLHAGLAVALATEKSAEAGNQADDGIEAQRRLRKRFLGQKVGGLPFVRREEQLGVQIRQGSPQAHQLRDAPGDDQKRRQGALEPFQGA